MKGKIKPNSGYVERKTEFEADFESEIFLYDPFAHQFTPSFINPNNVPIVGTGRKLSITDQHGTRTYDCGDNGKPIALEGSPSQYQGDMELNRELMDQHDPRFKYK